MDAKTGCGVAKIMNSGDQNCQHGFQRFILFMLGTAWYILTVFFFPITTEKKPNRRAAYCMNKVVTRNQSILCDPFYEG